MVLISVAKVYEYEYQMYAVLEFPYERMNI